MCTGFGLEDRENPADFFLDVINDSQSAISKSSLNIDVLASVGYCIVIYDCGYEMEQSCWKRASRPQWLMAESYHSVTIIYRN